jgi:uncharacterized protein (DUF433 family)
VTLPVILVPHPHVRVDPHVLGGSPYIVGSRVLVRRLWSFYRSGTSVDTLLRRYPQLGPAKVFDAPLAFALDNPEVIEADVSREQEMLARAGQRKAPRAVAPEQIELPFGPIKAGAANPLPAAGVRRR